MEFYKITNANTISDSPECDLVPAPLTSPNEELLQTLIQEFEAYQYIDAQKLKNLLFPKQHLPIFLSYSAADAQAAYYIKNALDRKAKKEVVFMDQLFWENAHEVLHRIQFRKGESPIPADEANKLASQFYMLLSYALKEAIQQSEAFIVLIPSHCRKRGGLLYTTSAWIHHECDIARDIYLASLPKKQKEAMLMKEAATYPTTPVWMYPLNIDFMVEWEFPV